MHTQCFYILWHGRKNNNLSGWPEPNHIAHWHVPMFPHRTAAEINEQHAVLRLGEKEKSSERTKCGILDGESGL